MTPCWWARVSSTSRRSGLLLNALKANDGHPPVGSLKKQARARTRAQQKKENGLNSQPIMRAAMCVALVAACLASAGWFPTRPVSGQGTEPGDRVIEYGKLSENPPHESIAPGNPARNQQLYRSGLRNSCEEHQLNAKELNLVLTQLRHKTGFTQMRFDEDGFLTIDDRSQIAGGSTAARELLLATVDGKKSINLQSHNHSPRVMFGRLGEGVKYIGWSSNLQIVVAPVEIDFADFNHPRGDREAVEAFDLGFVILHELCHAALELHDPSAGANAAGDCESSFAANSEYRSGSSMWPLFTGSRPFLPARPSDLWN